MRFTPVFVAFVVLSVIASHAHAQEVPVVPLTGSTPLVVTVTPTATVFMPGDTVNIIATRGEGAAPSTGTFLLISENVGGEDRGFALQIAELRIEAVALDGSTTAAIQDGIEIGFPDAAYDSIAGHKAGGVTIDGFQVAVDDIGPDAGRVYAERPTTTANSHGFTTYSPGVSSDLVNSLGSTHIIRMDATGVALGSTTEFTEIPTLGELLRLISAQEISIASTYTGGSFKLRVTLIEHRERNRGQFDGTRNSVTVETLIPFPGIRLRIRTFLEGALQ